jgi:hypothetical protein
MFFLDFVSFDAQLLRDEREVLIPDCRADVHAISDIVPGDV